MSGEATAAAAHKLVDAASYDATADAFDELTERFAAPLAERMLDLAAIRPSDRVLDVGSGTGLVAIRAGRRVETGRVLGIDHSQGMLGRAADKARAAGLAGKVAFQAMDAEALDLADGAFDAVVSLFVLRHLPNPAVAVKEMRRVLAPGGRLAVAVGSGPSLFSLQGVSAAARTLASNIRQARGRLLLAPDFLKGLMVEQGLWAERNDAGHHHHIDVAAIIRQAGFSSVRASWAGSSVDLDPETFWAVQATYGSNERVRLAELDPAQVARLKAEFLTRAAAVVAKGGKLTYRYGAMYYEAVR